MALLTRSPDASPDVNSAKLRTPNLAGLVAGEALDPAAPCYIKSADGKIYMSNATADDDAAHCVGFTPKAYVAGEPVTLLGPGCVFHYADSGLTPGALFYLGATAGRLDTAATTGDSQGVAMALDAKHILIIRYKVD